MISQAWICDRFGEGNIFDKQNLPFEDTLEICVASCEKSQAAGRVASSRIIPSKCSLVLPVQSEKYENTKSQNRVLLVNVGH